MTVDRKKFLHRALNYRQFSAYDERPDPKKPGQQGTLFRKVAPAREGFGSQKEGARQPDKEPYTGIVRYMNPHELYHGSISGSLRPGRLIRPGRPSNWPGKTKDYNAEHVFATGDLTQAYHHAMRAATNAQKPPAIFRVQPTGPVQYDVETRPDKEWYDPENDDTDPVYQSKKPMRVMERIPIQEARDEYEMEFGTHIQSWKKDF